MPPGRGIEYVQPARHGRPAIERSIQVTGNVWKMLVGIHAGRNIQWQPPTAPRTSPLYWALTLGCLKCNTCSAPGTRKRNFQVLHLEVRSIRAPAREQRLYLSEVLIPCPGGTCTTLRRKDHVFVEETVRMAREDGRACRYVG